MAKSAWRSMRLRISPCPFQEVCLYGEGGGPDMVVEPAVELPSVFPRYDGRFLWLLNLCGWF